jgi:hypothetical protein
MSAKNTKTVFKLFGAWNDRREENWLKEMASKGWHLESAAVVFYKFRRGEPADMTYRMDFQTAGKFDKKEYLDLFRDAGWEFVGRNGAWFYFRTPTGKGKEPEIHTDMASRIAKYRRLLLLLIIILVVLSNSTFNLLGNRIRGGFWTGLRIFQGIMLAFLFYGTIRLIMLVSRLKKEGIGREGQ